MACGNYTCLCFIRLYNKRQHISVSSILSVLLTLWGSIAVGTLFDFKKYSSMPLFSDMKEFDRLPENKQKLVYTYTLEKMEKLQQSNPDEDYSYILPILNDAVNEKNLFDKNLHKSFETSIKKAFAQKNGCPPDQAQENQFPGESTANILSKDAPFSVQKNGCLFAYMITLEKNKLSDEEINLIPGICKYYIWPATVGGIALGGYLAYDYLAKNQSTLPTLK